MAARAENWQKARLIFDMVFAQLKMKGDQPVFEAGFGRYKSKVGVGPLKGRPLYISEHDLEDSGITVEQIRRRLVAQLKEEMESSRY
jgi:hypothetical protein